MRRTPLALAITLVSASFLVQAEAQKPTSTQLDGVTISGTRTETSVMDNPISIAVVNRDQIEKRGADSVAELLRDIPGVGNTEPLCT